MMSLRDDFFPTIFYTFLKIDRDFLRVKDHDQQKFAFSISDAVRFDLILVA